MHTKFNQFHLQFFKRVYKKKFLDEYFMISDSDFELKGQQLKFKLKFFIYFNINSKISKEKLYNDDQVTK